MGHKELDTTEVTSRTHALLGITEKHLVATNLALLIQGVPQLDHPAWALYAQRASAPTPASPVAA